MTPVIVVFLLTKSVAFVLQCLGAILVSSTQTTDKDAQSKLDNGKKIVLGGLGVQIACFGIFMIVSVRFNFTSRLFSGANDQKDMNLRDRKNKLLKSDWWNLLRVVNFGCLLILVSSNMSYFTKISPETYSFARYIVS
jgi:RTA1 like protein